MAAGAVGLLQTGAPDRAPTATPVTPAPITTTSLRRLIDAGSHRMELADVVGPARCMEGGGSDEHRRAPSTPS